MMFLLYSEYHMPIPLCRNAHFFVHSGSNVQFIMGKLMGGKKGRGYV
jgi:hypothetical protein